VSTLRPLKGAERAALIIRHGDRHEITAHNIKESLSVGLTEKGFSDAERFGRSLPFFLTIRLFHSPAVRCRETAQMISRGAGSQGIDVVLIQEEWKLCAPYMRDDRCLQEAARLGYDFLRTWMSGQISPELVDGVESSAFQVVEPILSRLPGKENCLDIHVSHDWDIMLLREFILGIRHEEAGWLSCLDGMSFLPRDGGCRVCYREDCVTINVNDGCVRRS
jgi:broad specificity phosphatase PhoE